MLEYNRRRSRRKAKSRAPDLFDWAHERDLIANPVVHAISRKSRVSPTVAAVILELSGLTRRSRDD